MLDVIAQIGLGILEMGVHAAIDSGALSLSGAPDEESGSEPPESNTGASKPAADEVHA